MKHRLYLFLVFAPAFLCVAGCLQNTSETNREKTTAHSAQAAINTNISPSKKAENTSQPPPEKRSEDKTSGKLVCSPKRLQKGDVLTLAMNKPHGGYLEIITPSKEYIFISSESGDKLLADARKYNVNPYYAESELTSMSELKIDTAKAMTIDYKGGEVNEKLLLARIFAESGKYKILLSNDSFETDDPTITGQCEIYYANVNQQ